ncbi:uncharacterized protein [Physcomitrium patens]|uniref:Uncharacterized protein n=1 Tax=Physcomitrium patens TaxID=3218 RepID=A9SAM2_PHYPA|nr:uncharacterized protein LOC112281218 [Physcomitrium patens]XP_024373255.1 uncharacterized protein LOC112281218 [Physcomitrium patens]XP_024373256.1 uncharacterized protein LOC112281218 [Physcomitrium patens]PNR55846.1 hypothetical protein PHYPA_006743 [Physcomitrium patens]|eukprot:XP_024373254.1 uncharacterized protein LOC112281218 [Physcomitrella patens]
MTMLGCKWHPSQDNVGVCAHCLRESLSRLAVYQDEEDDSVDLEVFPPSKPSAMPAGSRRAQFILVQYDEDGNPRGCLGADNSDLFYPGVNRNAMGALVGSHQHAQHVQAYVPDDNEAANFNLDSAGPVDMQMEVGTSEDSGSGVQDEATPPNMLVTVNAGESGRQKRKLHSSSGRRKSKSWGAAMLKVVGFRTLSVLWRSEKKSEAVNSKNKPNEQGYDGSVESGAPAHDQQFTPTRFSVSSNLEQTTPARYSVSSQWEQTTPARYSVASVNEQITPARYSGASLFDIESMDSRRFSTSSRGSPFMQKPVINGENFNAAWKASKSSVNGRKTGPFEGLGRDEYSGKVAGRSYGDEIAGQGRKSPWKWFSSFKGSSSKEDKSLSQQKPTPEPPSDPVPYQERRKSTSSLYATKSRDRNQIQPLTPVLSSKKSPWWRASPYMKAQSKSPINAAAKAGTRDPETATDSDLMDDTPHRLSSASPMVGYSRSSSNGSSCFTTPRWNTRHRQQHGGHRGIAAHEREHEITHLAI